jgi:hypothetical protein
MSSTNYWKNSTLYFREKMDIEGLGGETVAHCSIMI